MLNATTGASTLPRDVIQWLDRLDLSYSVRNPKMDLANGFIVAQILTREYPEDKEKMNILTYYNCQAKDKKVNNWEQIQKFLARKNFKVSKEEYESILNLGPETAQSFLFRLYEKVTGNKLNIDRRLVSLMPQPEEKLYKKPTASHVAKDRQLHRVVDDNQKHFRTQTLLTKHKNHIHNQKYNTGLIQWLIDKRKQQIQHEVDKQREDIQKKTKSIVQNESKIEVREIQLKCFNSSTSKKNRADGDFIQNKGILEFLAQSCSLLFKKENIANDLKKLGLEVREKQPSNLSIIQQMFKRCDENDVKGVKKLSPETLKRIVDQFKKTSEMNLIIDNISSNFIDFRKFFELFYKPLRIYDKESDTFKNILSLLSKVAAGLLKRDSNSAQLMFQQIALPSLLKIGQNQYKKASISSICLEFVRQQSESYYSLTQKVKQIYCDDSKCYVSYLARFLEIIVRNFEHLQQNLWSQLFYYGFFSLNNASPSVRVNGAKIISLLFTEVAVAGDEIINEKMPILKKLIVDPWWEVQAQALIIYKAILMSKYKNQSQESGDLNQNLNMKTILHYILQIFKPNVSHNILRVGLVELAELLNFQESLCDRYLEILLHVGSQIRSDVLNTSVIKYGPVVYGSNTFTYKLTGAPLLWNSIGVAKTLHVFLEKEKISNLSYPHLQIMHSAILRNQNNGRADDWLEIFENFKEKIFATLLDEELCHMGASIIKQFLKIQDIHSDLIDSSRLEVARTLSQLYVDVGESEVKNNLLDFFDYLKDTESEYTYKILKDFAERQKSKYLSSNLVDFMNELSRNRRKQMFNEI